MIEYDLATERNELLIWQQHRPVSGIWCVTEPVSNARLYTVWFHLSWTSWERGRNQISGCQGLCRGETDCEKGTWALGGELKVLQTSAW